MKNRKFERECGRKTETRKIRIARNTEWIKDRKGDTERGRERKRYI